MAGKTPSRGKKDKPHSVRPYDRPQNQSLFGKVASTVKGFLPSSWLWINTRESNNNSLDSNAPEADMTENEEDTEPEQPIRPRLSNKAKRPRLEAETNLVPSDSYMLMPSTSRGNLTVTDEMRDNSRVIPNCQLVRQEVPIVANGDDHSENSDGSASTSGCSSLVSSQDKPHRSSGLKLSESALATLRLELKNKPVFQPSKRDASILTETFFGSSPRLNQSNSSLWSCGTQTPITTPQRSSLIHSSRPSFNISSFGTSPKLNSMPGKISSPFYEGTTTFGGASAYRRAQVPSSPYQRNPTVKSVRNQTSLKGSSSNEDLECMSSAAKRILNILENMSTPVTDAKKIPNEIKSPLDIPLSITPPSQRLKSYLSFPRRSPLPSLKGPPVVNLNTLSKLAVLKNHNARISRNSMMEIPLQEQPVISLSESVSVTTSSSSRQDTRPCGGKMKTKLREPLHASLTTTKRQQEEENNDNEEYELPAVPLPIRTAPKISLSLNKPVDVNQTEEMNEETARGEPSFTFSSPIEYSTSSLVLQTGKTTDNGFKFSSPLVVSSTSVSSSSSEKIPNHIASSLSVEDTLQRMRETAEPASKTQQMSREDLFQGTQNKSQSSSKTGTPTEDRGFKFSSPLAPCSTSAPTTCINQLTSVDDILKQMREKTEKKNTSTENSQQGFGDAFKPQSNTWECSSCLVRNKKEALKCAACETINPNNKQNNSSGGFGEAFRPPANTWECSSCMVRNEESSSKCVSCENPKPGSMESSSSGAFGETFRLLAGTWECPSCMVRNKESDSKCLACENPNPSVKNKNSAGTERIPRTPVSRTKVTSQSKNAPTENASDVWECDTCYVRNTLETNKCCACETLRPINTADTGAFHYVFGKVAQGTPPVALSFGSQVSTFAPTTTTSAFTFGVASNTVSSSPTSSAVFGASPLPKGNIAPTPTTASFKFGVPVETATSQSVTTTPSSLGFSAEAAKLNTVTSTDDSFNFGAPKDTGKSNVVAPDSSTFKFGVPTDTSTSNVGTSGSTFKFGVSTEAGKINQVTTSSMSNPFRVASSTPTNIAQSVPTSNGNPNPGSEKTEEKLVTNPFRSDSAKPFSAHMENKLETVSSVPDSGTPKFQSSVTTTSSLEGFKCPSTTTAAVFGSSVFGSGIKFGVPSTTAASTTWSSSSAPSQTLPRTVFSAPSNSMHSTPETQLVQSSEQKQAQLSCFGAPTNVPNSTAAPTQTTSSFNAFGVFRTNSSQSQQVPSAVVSNTKQSASGVSTAFAPQGNLRGATSNPTFPFNTPMFPAASNGNMSDQTEMKQQSAVFQMGSPMSTSFTTSSTAPVFAFGNNNAATPVSSASGFTISSATGTPICVGDNAQKNPGIFTFGDSSKTEVKTSDTGFAFKRSADSSGFGFKRSADENSGFAATNNMSFGGFKTEQTNTGALGSSQATSAPAPFKFGSTPATSGGFQFGAATKTEPAQTNKGQLTFGSGAPKQPTFGSFQQPQSSSNTAQGFNFVGGMTGTTSAPAFNPTSTAAFTFGGKSNQPATVNQVPTNPAPLFGANPTPQPMFGGNAASVFGNVAAPSFGNIPQKAETGGGFNFGAPNAAANQSVFVFGAPSGKKPALPDTPAQGTPGFNFTMTPHESAGSFQPSFNMSTPPSFNFGATSTPAPNQPFQFAASSDGSSNPSATSHRKVRKAIRRGTRKPD